jgi:hypothetical protein
MYVLDFFRENVAQKTVSFWTLWLKLRPYYALGLLVTIATPDREALTNYRGNLISAFSSLLFRESPTDERTKVHLNCQNLLCDNATINHSHNSSRTHAADRSYASPEARDCQTCRLAANREADHLR